MSTSRTKMLAPTLALAVAASLTACSDDSAGPETGVDVEDVAEAGGDEAVDEAVADEETAAGAPAALVGQPVTVSAEIEEIVSPEAFLIGQDAQALVVGSTSFEEMGFELSDGLIEDDVVFQITGTVRDFDIAGFEEEFGVDYDDELFEPYEGTPVIVADDISTLQGETVTVAGSVDRLISTVAFGLTGVGWNVVVLDAQQAQVSPGDYVQVTGTARSFDIAAFEDEFGVDLDDELYAPFEGDMVLVAESVTPATPVAAP